jgi:hypothetical protein
MWARDNTCHCRSSLPAHAIPGHPHFTLSTQRFGLRLRHSCMAQRPTRNPSTYLGPPDIPPDQSGQLLQWIQTAQSQWHRPHRLYGDGSSASWLFHAPGSGNTRQATQTATAVSHFRCPLDQSKDMEYLVCCDGSA